MNENEIETIEIDLIIDAMYKRYGHDFRQYARASIERRIRRAMIGSGCENPSDMIPRLLHDETFFEQMLQHFSITVTDMFRDPLAYLSIRQQVVPFLNTYPFVRIWHAGCATGEEVYSLAIMLEEEGLARRSTVFATDFNDSALQHAREGIYDLDRVKKFTRNYQQAGGHDSFSGYYHARYGAMSVKAALKKNITFANHNLATDQVFGEMHLIMCRNVLIYFNKDLQARVLRLFRDSLVRGGFLCLGSKESLSCSDVSEDFEAVDEKWRIFRKVSGELDGV